MTAAPSGAVGGPSRNYFTLSTTYYYVSLALIAAISLWIRKGFPVYLAPNAVHDDGLFLNMARYLKAGAWLGPYGKYTLIKGMIYPLFVCVVSFAPIPLKVAEQAVYLAASALTAGLVRRRAGNNHLALILFTVLAFNPVLWNLFLARVMREGLYVSLSLAVVALAVVVAFPTQSPDRYGLRILRGVTLGLLGGAFWLTREEGIWLLPTLAVVLAVAIIGVLWPQWLPHSEKEIFSRRSDHLKAIALPFVVAFAVFLATDGFVAGLNYEHYGLFETNEFRAKSFLRAYGALMRIQHDEWQHYMFFPKDARQRAYSASPAARELTPTLDGRLAELWRIEGCRNWAITPCSEVRGGFFMWELRDAVAEAGHYGSGLEAMRFYDTLADEINAACARGSIGCLPSRATMLPPFRKEYIGEALRSAKNVANVLFTMGNGAVGSSPSPGTLQEANAFADLVHGFYPPSVLVIQGWAAAASETPAIQVFAHADQSARASISLLPAQDVVAAYPGLKAVRFRIETDCSVDACDLVVAEPAGRFKVALAELGPQTSFRSQGAMLAIETFSVPDPEKYAGPAQLKIASILAAGYAIAFPVLAAFGVCGLLLAAVFQRQHPMPASVLALGLGSLAAVVTRIGLLAYIDATSFPSAVVIYTSPASPFAIIFTAIGIYSGCSIILKLKPWLLFTGGLSQFRHKSTGVAVGQ